MGISSIKEGISEALTSTPRKGPVCSTVTSPTGSGLSEVKVKVTSAPIWFKTFKNPVLPGDRRMLVAVTLLPGIMAAAVKKKAAEEGSPGMSKTGGKVNSLG
jgi:hypothetical protein